jgi:Methyltransferase FkbM domain
VQRHSPTGRFDFIKLDIEGAELEIFNDKASHAVLCEAKCFFMELHKWRKGSRKAFNGFLRSPCGLAFRNVVTTGEFELYCQDTW